MCIQRSLSHAHAHIEKIEILEKLSLLLLQAQRHLLVIARADGLDSIADVHKEHISLLKTMHAVGLKWAEKLLREDKLQPFRLGYHSVISGLTTLGQYFFSLCLSIKNDPVFFYFIIFYLRCFV